MGRVGLLVAASLLTLATLELGVRWLAPEPLESPVATRRGAFLTPGDHPLHTDEFDVQVHVNSDGFVDREWGPRVPGRARVIVVGDSFVQAAQVALPQGFGRMLDADLGPDVEVLSMGVPGAGTATALRLIDEQALPRDPDLVVLGFLVANDVLNNDPLLDGKPDKPYYRLQDGELLPWSLADAQVPVIPGWGWSQLVRKVGRTWLRDIEVRHPHRPAHPRPGSRARVGAGLAGDRGPGGSHRLHLRQPGRGLWRRALSRRRAGLP